MEFYPGPTPVPASSRLLNNLRQLFAAVVHVRTIPVRIRTP